MFRIALSLLMSLVASAASAQTFDIPPGAIQLVEFESDAPIENIRGISTEARGTLTFDPKNPSTGKGTVMVPVASLRTGNTTRDGHLQEPMWLDAKAHPDLSFKLDEVKLDIAGPLVFGATANGTIKGTFSIKGKKKQVLVPIKVAYLESSEKLRKVRVEGNALRVKGQLTLKLADFGVVPPEHLAGVKVAEEVEVRFALTAVEK